jgi:hypothetical protein
MDMNAVLEKIKKKEWNEQQLNSRLINKK